MESTFSSSVHRTYPASVESVVWGGVQPGGTTMSTVPPVVVAKSSAATYVMFQAPELPARTESGGRIAADPEPGAADAGGARREHASNAKHTTTAPRAIARARDGRRLENAR